MKNESIERTKSVLDRQRKIQAAIKLQSNIRGWFVRKRLRTLPKNEREKIRKRFIHFHEILHTEKTFVTSLMTLEQKFIDPITENAKKLNIGDAAVNYISGNISRMLELHKRLSQDLENLNKHSAYPVSIRVGELLNDFSAELRAEHMSFANNYVACIETIRHLQGSNPRFQTLITEVISKILFRLFEY